MGASKIAGLLAGLVIGCAPVVEQANFLPTTSAVTGVWSTTDAASPIAPDDRCENCQGTGRLGDGRVETTCPECGGTGKKTRSDRAVPAPGPDPPPAANSSAAGGFQFKAR